MNVSSIPDARTAHSRDTQSSASSNESERIANRTTDLDAELNPGLIPGRQQRREGRKFGIRIRMPENDPLAAPHLLGANWTGERWYRTAEERDRAFEAMQQQPGYYRIGDTPSVLLEKIDLD